MCQYGIDSRMALLHSQGLSAHPSAVHWQFMGRLKSTRVSALIVEGAKYRADGNGFHGQPCPRACWNPATWNPPTPIERNSSADGQSGSRAVLPLLQPSRATRDGFPLDRLLFRLCYGYGIVEGVELP